MSILVEDSPRNLATWIVDALSLSDARGTVITPWATPWVKLEHQKRKAEDTADMVRDVGGEVWFDPLTHALQMSNVGDFRWYDQYSLWAGARGDLSTAAAREDHIRRVYAVQDALGAPHLAPTVLLHHGESTTSQNALDLAEEAIRQDPTCWLSVAGTSPFWSGATELDAHIGALAQLRPGGWFLTVVRPMWLLPVIASAQEVYGLCRTTRALSEYARVHISHGDLAALPAIAAGAFSLGSGWDQRQRVCAMGAFAEREEVGGGGAWFERPTLAGLAGLLKRPEALLLQSRDPARAARLGTIPPPGPKEAFLGHMTALGQLINHVARGDYEARFRQLAEIYRVAAAEWPHVCAITSSDLDESDWIAELAEGFRLYSVDEGWVL